jgi:hypothetical protein
MLTTSNANFQLLCMHIQTYRSCLSLSLPHKRHSSKKGLSATRALFVYWTSVRTICPFESHHGKVVSTSLARTACLRSNSDNAKACPTCRHSCTAKMTMIKDWTSLIIRPLKGLPMARLKARRRRRRRRRRMMMSKRDGRHNSWAQAVEHDGLPTCVTVHIQARGILES